jgi:hypothetical protein
LAAARVTQSLADLCAASGESCSSLSMQRVAAAQDVESAAAAAAAAVSDTESLLAGVVASVERAAKDATTAAAAAERAFVAAKGMVDLEDRRCVCCTLAALLHLSLNLRLAHAWWELSLYLTEKPLPRWFRY